MESCPIKLLMLVFQEFFHGSSQFMSCVGGNEAFTASFCCWVSVLCAILFWKKNDKLLRTSRSSGLAQHWKSLIGGGWSNHPLSPLTLFLVLSNCSSDSCWRPPRPHICLSLVYFLGPGLSFSYLIFKYYLFCLLRHTRSEFSSNSVVPSSLAPWLGNDAFNASPLDDYWSQGTYMYIFYFWLCCTPDSHIVQFDLDVCRVLSKNVNS